MSVASEMQRIADALDAVSAGKDVIADAITAKGVPTPTDSTFEELATNVGLIEGGGGGNLRRLKILDTVMSDTHAYPLDSLLQRYNLKEVEIVITFAGTPGTLSIFCGFDDNAAPLAQYQQMFQFGCRGAAQTVTRYYPPGESPNNVGYWSTFGLGAYSTNAGVGYGRSPKATSTFFVIKNDADVSALIGAHLDIYAIHSI